MALHLHKASSGARLARDIRPDTYLTDGRRLFRVIRGFCARPEESFALLEDCRTLEAREYAADELWRMGLRVVERTPEAEPQATPEPALR